MEMGRNVADNSGVEPGAETPDLNHQGTSESDPMATPKTKRTTSPAFQFYPESWFSSSKVTSMSHTERGIYIDLLARCWLDNGLPTDVRKIAALVHIPGARFQRIWSEGALHECFVEKNGKLVNPRQERERKKQSEFQRRQSDNAKSGWQRRGNAVASPTQCQESPSGTTRALETERETETPVVAFEEKGLDLAFAKFRDSYPEERRKGGYLVQQQFMAEAEKAGGSFRLMAALTNHRASEQWSNPKHIPGMDVWLREERWRQTLPASSPSQHSNLPEWARKAKAAAKS